MSGTVSADELETEAAAFVTETQARIASILLTDDRDAGAKRALLMTLLSERLNLSAMAQMALGTRVEAFSREQFGEFVQEYSQYLSSIYLREIAWADPSQVAAIAEAKLDPESGRVTVQTHGKLRTSVARIPTRRMTNEFVSEFVLMERRGNWSIIRIRFNGVDLNRNYGEQFKAVLESSSPEQLLEDLRKQNDRFRGENPLK